MTGSSSTQYRQTLPPPGLTASGSTALLAKLGAERREGRGEELECKHMSLDFVYPPMVTPELIHLNLGTLKELQTHGRKRVNNVDLLRARARSLDLS